MRSSRIAVAGMAIFVFLTGCSTQTPPSPSQPSSAAESTPEPQEQARETGLTSPTLVFDGRCDLVFSDAELTSVMGQTLTLDDNHFTELWGGDALFNQNGGFECTWQGGGARVIALLLPEAAVDYSPRDHQCGGTHDSDAFSCPMESVVNEIRISGYSTIGQDAVAATTARDALLAIFAEKAAQQTPVSVPLPAIGSWAVPVPCAAIEGADFSAVPGLGAGVTDAGPPGYGKDTTQAEQALGLEGFSPSCILLGESVELEYVAVGGARWREVGIAARADATALTLDGVEAAYGVPYATQNGESLTLVYAFSGPNMLVFTVKFTKNAAGIATAFFAALDATAVS